MVKGSESHAERYPEDEYLFEIDDNPDPSVDSGLPWSFTERAQRAQAAVRAALQSFSSVTNTCYRSGTGSTSYSTRGP